MASLGLTYILTPAKESAAANNMKITKLNTNAMVLNLYIRDVLHDEESNHLQGHRAAQHDIADVVQEEEAHVVRVGVKREHRDPDGNATERDARHAPMRADGLDAAPQLEALADHIGQLVQDLGQVAAGALLQQHRGNEKVHVQ